MSNSVRDHILDEEIESIDSGRDLSEREIRSLIWEGYTVSEGEDRRWSKTMETVVEYKGRYFLIEWEKGLTECQENYYEQPYEVVKTEEKRIVEVVDVKYTKLKKKEGR